MTIKKNGRPLKLEGKRTKFIKARLNDVEYQFLSNLWTELGLKESDYLRLRLLKPMSISVKVNSAQLLEKLDTINADIGRAANNINQLARHANFMNKRGMLSTEVIIKFNQLFTDYILLFKEMEKYTRILLRLLKT